MIWASLFAISIAQGIFLIFLIAVRGTKNSLALRLIIALVSLMVLTNLGYLVIRTELVKYIPQLFGLPFGMMFLFGPLFYFYSKSVMDNSFRWKMKYWFHFFPYFIYFAFLIPFLFTAKVFWFEYISTFLSGHLRIRFQEKITFAIQDLQLSIYLIVTFKWIQSAGNKYGNGHYIIPVSSRIKWLKALTFCFALFLITVFSLYIFLLIHGKYNPITNYIYTLITSGIIYFIAYKLVLNPELISPDFAKKYKTVKQFENNTNDEYISRIKFLMEIKKIYTNPDLKLAALAEELKLQQYQVSKLINENFNKSFNELINEYRVGEFIIRVNDSRYKSLSIYGIAMDVGFNSKSAFNNTFKKITGKTPSTFKRDV